MRRRGFTLGVGCRRGADTAALADLVGSVLGEAGISDADLAVIATISGRDKEPAIISLAQSLGVPVRTYPAERLEQETPRLVTPSDVVFRETGCHGVAESAALAAAGAGGRLVVPKRVSGGCTAAVAEAGSP